MEQLVFSQNPSAKVALPGGVVIGRTYDTLSPLEEKMTFVEQEILCPGEYQLPGVRLTCIPNESGERTVCSFAVTPKGKMVLRSRKTGDTIRLCGGTKRLKKLYIDEKIPAGQRDTIPVLADDEGVLGVIGFGGNLDRISSDGTVRIQLEYL